MFIDLGFVLLVRARIKKYTIFRFCHTFTAKRRKKKKNHPPNLHEALEPAFCLTVV